MKFDRTFRQKVVDEFLNATGRNIFVPQEFIDWLRPQPEHRVWDIFFGKSEEEAANEWRLLKARNFIGGLRLKIAVSQTPDEGRTLSLQVDERAATSISVPAFVSPMSERRGGGGYYGVDVSDAATMAEFARQAERDIRRFIERYAGISALLNVSLNPLHDLASEFGVHGAQKKVAAE